MNGLNDLLDDLGQRQLVMLFYWFWASKNPVTRAGIKAWRREHVLVSKDPAVQAAIKAWRHKHLH